ncbi:universal stress protein [Amnibacterium sp.]|uniref:universal stress protein n=1 Tax=Amnibacterium sp. TaxID=1872496 RepID=UPI00260D9EA0|nr:universal stress protein [Amnibacterium sp.]MCU1472703.1 hypothetical protein [Amnibacterium sp.]
MRITRLVVGWDASSPAEQALRWAANADERIGRPVHLVTVLTPGGTDRPEEAVAAARDALQAALNGLMQTHPDLTVTAEVAVGDPAEELPRVAGRDSLLVIGASKAAGRRQTGARRVPVAIAGRGDGVTAIVPAEPLGGRRGIFAVVRGRERTRGALTFAAQAARILNEPLTLLRIRDPYEPVDGLEPVTLRSELGTLTHEFPDLTVNVDPHWVRSPACLLTHSDHAALLVLEGHRPSCAPPRFSPERWLAAQAQAPFVVVAEPSVQQGKLRIPNPEQLALRG